MYIQEGIFNLDKIKTHTHTNSHTHTLMHEVICKIEFKLQENANENYGPFQWTIMLYYKCKTTTDKKEPKNERHTTYCKMNEKQKNSTLLHRSVITCLSITIILQSTEYMKGTNT